MEGIGNAPAFRGIAYALFEDMQLEDFGNRIPSLTFEVEADDGPVGIAAIGAALGGAGFVAGESEALLGYAASGESVRAALEPLNEILPIAMIEEGGRLRLAQAGRGAAADVDPAEEGATSLDGAGGASRSSRAGADAAPASVSIGYHDRDRDYQTGLQQARSGEGMRDIRIGLAATLDAPRARAWAEQRLAEARRGRDRAVIHLPWRAAGLTAGAVIRLSGRPGRWRIERRTIDRMVVTLELVRTGGGAAASETAAPGRPIGHPDLRHGATRLIVAELPNPEGSAGGSIGVSVAAAGGAGWRRASISLSLDGGASWTEAGATAPAAIMGVTSNALAPGGSALVDARGGVEVELDHHEMALESRSDAALARGENAALIGDEIVQFGLAEQIGERRFRLSRLLRGRRGTEWAAATHRASERFVLISADTIARVAAPAATVGSTVTIAATGIEDDTPAVAELILTGEGIRPPAPVHLRAAVVPEGLLFTWVRRSREGWTWSSGVDAPLGEETEAYRVTLTSVSASRTETVASARWLYPAAARAQDGAAGVVTFSVEQIGTRATSRPASLVVALPDL